VTLVGTDYPAQLDARGMGVYAYDGWNGHGSSADHKAVVIHHTASSPNASPKADADYCHSGADDSPLYNVLVDRKGEAWVLAREKANSSGDINSVALNEAIAGRANLTPAAVRGLNDDTSNNSALFAVCGQNNGVGETWADALVEGIAIACAVACEHLGLTPGHVTTHRALTSRKIDPDGGNCPDDWTSIVAEFMGGKGADDMPSGAQQMVWTKSGAGYWIVGSDGGVFAYGDAGFFGSMGDKVMNAPVVGIAVTPTERGYSLLGQDGGTFHFGDAIMLGAPTGDIR
jgi:hypothetical protein